MDAASNHGSMIALNINQAIMIEEVVTKNETTNLNKDAILSDLANLGAEAYQYKISPLFMGGGNGTYKGFSVSPNSRWGKSNPNATFVIVTQTATKLTLKATSKKSPGTTMDVTYDGNGRIVDGPNSSGF